MIARLAALAVALAAPVSVRAYYAPARIDPRVIRPLSLPSPALRPAGPLRLPGPAAPAVPTLPVSAAAPAPSAPARPAPAVVPKPAVLDRVYDGRGRRVTIPEEDLLREIGVR